MPSECSATRTPCWGFDRRASFGCGSRFGAILALAHAHSRDLIVLERDGRIRNRALSLLGDERGAMGDEGMCFQSSNLSITVGGSCSVFQGLAGDNGYWEVTKTSSDGLSLSLAIWSNDMVALSGRDSEALVRANADLLDWPLCVGLGLGWGGTFSLAECECLFVIWRLF